MQIPLNPPPPHQTLYFAPWAHTLRPLYNSNATTLPPKRNKTSRKYIYRFPPSPTRSAQIPAARPLHAGRTFSQSHPAFSCHTRSPPIFTRHQRPVAFRFRAPPEFSVRSFFLDTLLRPLHLPLPPPSRTSPIIISPRPYLLWRPLLFSDTTLASGFRRMTCLPPPLLIFRAASALALWFPVFVHIPLPCRLPPVISPLAAPPALFSPCHNPLNAPVPVPYSCAGPIFIVLYVTFIVRVAVSAVQALLIPLPPNRLPSSAPPSGPSLFQRAHSGSDRCLSGHLRPSASLPRPFRPRGLRRFWSSASRPPFLICRPSSPAPPLPSFSPGLAFPRSFTFSLVSPSSVLRARPTPPEVLASLPFLLVLSPITPLPGAPPTAPFPVRRCFPLLYTDHRLARPYLGLSLPFPQP